MRPDRLRSWRVPHRWGIWNATAPDGGDREMGSGASWDRPCSWRGEARHPGPVTLGISKPSGLRGKELQVLGMGRGFGSLQRLINFQGAARPFNKELVNNIGNYESWQEHLPHFEGIRPGQKRRLGCWRSRISHHGKFRSHPTWAIAQDGCYGAQHILERSP